MHKLWWTTVVFTLCFSNVANGQASGSYEESDGQFPITYAVAERDAGSDTVRILLAQETPPPTLNPDPHPCIILAPTDPVKIKIGGRGRTATPLWQV